MLRSIRASGPVLSRSGSRRAVVLTAAFVFVLAAAPAAAPAGQLTIRMVRVGAPNNPSASVVPFTDAIYPSCSAAPQTKAGCVTIGSVSRAYSIGELEVTVAQWVVFLNTADPRGTDPHDLY